MIAQAISMATASLRFEGELNCNLPEFQTNLVPFPRCHYPVCSYAPFVSAEKAFHDSHDVKEITSALFEPGNILVDCEQGTCLADCPGVCEKKHQKDDDYIVKNGVSIEIKHKYMAACLLYRGDVLPAEANRAVTILKQRKTIQFVDWIGDGGFKMGINKSRPIVPLNSDLAKTNRAAMLISNTTKISNVIQKICYKFRLLDRKRAFNHWYVGAGMEEGELAEAITNLEALQKDYEECCLTNEDFYGGN
jgi:tubulin alpha